MKIRATSLIVYATKLRNAALFRECVVWLCSAWNELLGSEVLETLSLDHPKIYKVLKRACGDIALEAVGVHDQILQYENSNSYDKGRLERVRKLRSESLDSAVFFHKFKKSGLDFSQKTKLDLDWLCQNRLAMNSDQAQLSKGFFCAVVEDEDLPWDINELEW